VAAARRKAVRSAKQRLDTPKGNSMKPPQKCRRREYSPAEARDHMRGLVDAARQIAQEEQAAKLDAPAKKTCPECGMETTGLILDNQTLRRACWRYFETPGPCRRKSGKLRAFFRSREDAEAFAEDPANIPYHGDVAHLCDKCGYWHLSRFEWLYGPLPDVPARLM
jgi:hypothetical protein